MLSNRILLKFFFALVVTLLFQPKLLAQSDKFTLTDDNIHKDDIVMTWNKNTPESEMKDDIKALSEKGITIKYSNVKRNSNDEITAIKVDYSDRKGNKGALEYNNQKSIATIKFYKNGEEIGFGEPNSFNTMIAGNDLMNGFNNPQDLMKKFNFGNGDKNSQSFSFSFPNDGESFGQSKSKIMIQKDGKKPLVIEDGKVTEGGEDYTPEEIEKIKSENKVEHFGYNDLGGSNKEFDFRNTEGLENFKKQMQEMKSSFGTSKEDNELEETKKEMLKAKDEMIKAREELEKAKKEVEKSKVKLKTQKA